MEQTMSYYMELLATNQPWNLIIFMAISVILAETIAVTELFLLFGRNFDTKLGTVNRVAGTTAGSGDRDRNGDFRTATTVDELLIELTALCALRSGVTR